jgi:hypothetical protein
MNRCAATYVPVCKATKSDSAVKDVMIRCNKSGDGKKIGDGNTENWTKVLNWILPKQWRCWAFATAVITFGL